MFEKNKGIYCESCSQKNKIDYDLIVGYLRVHPGATIMEIITETGAALKSIDCFIEDGSVSYAENNNAGNGKIFKKYDDIELKTSKFYSTMRSRR